MPKVIITERCMQLIQKYADEHGHLFAEQTPLPTGGYEIDLSQKLLDRLEPYHNPARPLSETLEVLLILSGKLPRQ